MSSLTSPDKRERARRIRELAPGFDRETMTNMLALANELEEEANAEEAAPAGRLERGSQDNPD